MRYFHTCLKKGQKREKKRDRDRLRAKKRKREREREFRKRYVSFYHNKDMSKSEENIFTVVE